MLKIICIVYIRISLIRYLLSFLHYRNQLHIMQLYKYIKEIIKKISPATSVKTRNNDKINKIFRSNVPIIHFRGNNIF